MDLVIQESIDRWNKISTSKKIALILYSKQIEHGDPDKGLQDYVSSFEDYACVFDVPFIKNEE